MALLNNGGESMHGGLTTVEEVAWGGRESAGEVAHRGASMRRRRLGPRRETPSSVEGDRCPNQTSICYSLERGEGDTAYARATSLGGGLFTTPSSIPTSWE